LAGPDHPDASFENQGGVSDSNPNPIKRWVSSLFIRRQSSLDRRRKSRKSAEKARQKKNEPHQIHYFHELDDGYSLLAVQLLEQFRTKYDVDLHCHIATREASDNIPEPDLLNRLSRTDGQLLAPHFNLLFPDTKEPADPIFLKEANVIALELAANNEFSELTGLTTAVISNNYAAIGAFQHQTLRIAPNESEKKIKRSNELRKQLGHYSGAMFYYAGEWYWGIDRLYHLEKRLIELGVNKDESDDLICPRPQIAFGPLKDSGNLKLRFFPSLRSPYTSIIFDKTLELADKTGVQLEISPVLPMVMRGVPATIQKGSYIMSDTAREAKELKIDWGKRVYDPIGEPVVNCYALYPWAKRSGKGEALLREFLKCAFFEGINTNSSSGMKLVVERAGLDWIQAKSRLYLGEWEPLIEKNRQDMLDLGCWGVPSYELSDSKGNTLVATWGQDRLWLISHVIQKYLKQSQTSNE
tara:strand:- start:768 stop:2174 length:1407 start_codon:yes stop_codon:yes gene_type:complete